MADLAVVEGTLSKAQACRDLVFITGEFEMMRSFLNVATAERVENPVLRTWVRQIRELAYDVEDFIELVVHLDKGKTSFWFRLRQLCVPWVRPPGPLDKIKQIKARVVQATGNLPYSLIREAGFRPVVQKQLPAPAVGEDTSNMLAEARDAAKREQVIRRDLTQLITKKVGDDHDLQVISIWGSAGERGTTSIIMEAYSDPQICRDFAYRAWVKLTHPFSPHDLIRNLMAQFCAADSCNGQQQQDKAISMDVLTAMQATKEDLCQGFQEIVTQARYLVVLEGLSSMAEWHALRAFVPNKRKGSCIIVSTQQTEIASMCIGHSYQILELKQFSAEHSVCALFKKIIKGSHTNGDKGKKPLVEDDFLVERESQKKAGSEPCHMPLHYLEDITNNFCNEQILGRGGFGVVYKGMLQNGKMIAVKKLVQSMPRSQEQFEKEVDLLMKLKHPNIVKLVGYCYETQHLHMPHEGKFVFAWKTETLLCLECLPNGSLDKYISDASSGLDWRTRSKIIEGMSYGLQHLHEKSNGPIIHLDLKPANILLDENMMPKITDFGLSRLFDQNQTIHTANTTGTLGYMPPEYVDRGIITPMADIFSLGVMIMEVITGHRDYPYDIGESSEGFIELELDKWRNRLQKEPGYTSLETDCKQIERCIQIGLMCVNPERTKRPTMKNIINMLQGLESMNCYISNELSSHEEP